METQRTELLNQLPKHGWNVVSVEEAYLEWWADEMWLLESVWSPVGSRAYVTFLVDPQAPAARKKGEYVWAAKASSGKPNQWLGEEGEFTLSLTAGWKEEMPAFFEHLSGLRNQNETPASSPDAAP
ncbi:MAG TPA: hypothetical protein VGB76_07730 [Pyrinomonadaceae bacterium]|jgi:hypothetical protein